MHITILTDNPTSWIMPYAQHLHDALAARNHTVVRCTRAEDIPRGDIACFLSCERIVPQGVLDRNQHNLVVHESALPQGKGFSPLTWQILAGQREIPITLFEATAECDAGPIYYQETMRFAGHELVNELRATQGATTVALILRFVDAYPQIHGIPQRGVGTEYPRRRPQDSALDPERSIADQFDALRVADNDRYPAFFSHRDHTYDLRITKRSPNTHPLVPHAQQGMSTAVPVRSVAVLQAHFSSTRLPGKVLKSILWESMISRHIERIRRSRRIQQFRAFLTFVRATEHAGWRRRIVNQSADIPWDAVPSGRTKPSAACFAEEAVKIAAYCDDAASVRAGMVALDSAQNPAHDRDV